MKEKELAHVRKDYNKAMGEFARSKEQIEKLIERLNSQKREMEEEIKELQLKVKSNQNLIDSSLQ